MHEPTKTRNPRTTKSIARTTSNGGIKYKDTTTSQQVTNEKALRTLCSHLPLLYCPQKKRCSAKSTLSTFLMAAPYAYKTESPNMGISPRESKLKLKL